MGVTSYPLYGMFVEPGAGHVEAGTKGPTSIGSDVWVGRRAMILSGVTIGHGAIIGAGAVFASAIAPYAVVIGNPARVLRMRFDEVTVSRDEQAQCLAVGYRVALESDAVAGLG